MKLLLAICLILPFLNLFGPNCGAQSKEYIDQCKLIRDFIDTADKVFFNFQKISPDSVIIVLDVNHILSDCMLDSFGLSKVIIINEGEAVDRIKKEGIFSSPAKSKNLFVFTKEKLGNLIGYRIFHPRSNGSCYWGFVKKNNHYYFSKESFGWF